MWQAYAVGSLVGNALENVIDKAAFVRDAHVDDIVATFWRQIAFFVLTLAVGIAGWMGPIHFFFSWELFGMCMLTVLSALAYTYMLRHVEVTGIALETYFLPLVFLVIDVPLILVSFSATQIFGIVLLSLGGFAFAYNVHTHRMRREYSLIVWGIFALWMVHDGVQFYLFKHLNATEGVNEVSFYASAWAIVIAVLFMYVAARRRTHRLFSAPALKYIPMTAFAKMFDVAAALMWARALSGAAVSQVAAVGAMQPVVMLAVAFLVQKETRFNIREHLGRAHLPWKVGGVALLSLGTFLLT